MILSRRSALALAIALLLPLLGSAARAEEIRVMMSGAFTEAFNRLSPTFERDSGHKIIVIPGASMGNAPDAIPVRLRQGQAADVLILADTAFEALAREGLAAAGTRVDLVRSPIYMAVRTGTPKPDISTVEALRRTLLDAPSIAYSASASGVYISTEMYQRLGIAEQVGPKSRRILSERVGSVVARGEAAVGFQQLSELLPIQGIDIVGPLPAEVQRVTIFSAGIAARAAHGEAGRALIRYLASPAAHAAIRETGLEPISQ